MLHAMHFPSFLSCRQRIVACQLEKSSKPIIGLEGGCAWPAWWQFLVACTLMVNKENIPTGSGHIPNLGIRAVQMLLVDFRTQSWRLKRAWLLDFLEAHLVSSNTGILKTMSWSWCQIDISLKVNHAGWTMITSVKMSQQNELVILVKVNYHDIYISRSTIKDFFHVGNFNFTKELFWTGWMSIIYDARVGGASRLAASSRSVYLGGGVWRVGFLG